jgi:AmiR/NasT family two-component response regulator
MIKTINIRSNLLSWADHGPVFDYSALETLEEFQSLANKATLILFVDRNQPENVAIVFGKEVLRMIAERIIPPMSLSPLTFAIDTSKKSSQLEHLIASVRVTKGFDEYE